MRARHALLGLTAIAALMPGAARADATPRGVHLALGTDPTTSATVAWHTAGSVDPGTVVEYGPTAALGTTISGTAKRAPGLPPATASTLHEATLSGLTPEAPVYYRVGDGANWSPVRTFRTLDDDAPFSFVAFGDHGIQPASQRTTAFVRDLAPDFAAIAGDVSYANSRLERWDTWAEQTEPLASVVPLMAAPGNHETDTGETPTPQAFTDRFAFPGAELFYSFDVGRAHLLFLHSTLRSQVTVAAVAQQIAFAEQDLAAAAQRKRDGDLDFVIVVQHHPLYGNQDADLAAQLQERNYNPALIAWEERLLHTYDVDLLIAGHNHHYERTKPMRYGTETTGEARDYVAPDGFLEVITGGGGAGLYDFKPDSDFPTWSVAHAKRHHVVRFDVEAGLIRARALATDVAGGELLDEWTLRAA